MLITRGCRLANSEEAEGGHKDEAVRETGEAGVGCVKSSFAVPQRSPEERDAARARTKALQELAEFNPKLPNRIEQSASEDLVKFFNRSIT